jgi:long-chain fatty acid transport protein
MAASGIATSAFATNGYFAHGIGVKAKAMGGASIAFAEDGFGAATNPANLAQVKDGYSVGVSAFAPDRGVTSGAGTGSGTWQFNQTAYGLTGTASTAYAGNEAADAFAIPEFAYVKTYNDKINWGVVVYGNGGMNVDYGRPMYDSSANTTSNLEQLFISPTISYKVDDRNTVAASLNIVYQTFKATGLNWFTAYTRGVADADVQTGAGGTNPGGHGTDDSMGVGVKLGWAGKLSDTANAGAFYQPKTSMDKFSAYKDLFAQDGGFDIPETYGVGVAIKTNPKTTVALDVVQINYSGIKSLANPNNHNPLGTSTDLGTENGKGFGWKDMTVYKLGVAHQMDANTTIRAGWNYGKQPISKGELDFNLLAPAVVEHHFTAGLTRALDKNSEFSVHAMYAPNVTLTGTNSDGAGTSYMSKLEMSQYEIGVQYSKKF